MGGQGMLDHVHGVAPVGARVHPAVEGDNGCPLNLGPCLQIMSIGNGFGAPLHGREQDALGEPVLHGGAVNTVEVPFGHMGDQVAHPIGGLILRHTDREFGVHQGDPGIKTFGLDKGLFPGLLV